MCGFSAACASIISMMRSSGLLSWALSGIRIAALRRLGDRTCSGGWRGGNFDRSRYCGAVELGTYRFNDRLDATVPELAQQVIWKA
jgi:hypothetical protein